MGFWTHEKIKGKEYYGNYEYAKTGKRVIFLETFNAKGKKIGSRKFSSPQAAVKAGWKYVK